MLCIKKIFSNIIDELFHSGQTRDGMSVALFFCASKLTIGFLDNFAIDFVPIPL